MTQMADGMSLLLERNAAGSREEKRQ